MSEFRGERQYPVANYFFTHMVRPQCQLHKKKESRAESRSMYDYCVIGGGVAGLGVALPLARDFHKTVVVLDRSRPQHDGVDRFRPSVAASFKNAGILELGVLRDIRAYFTSETVRLYRELGVEVRELGAIQPTTSIVDRAVVSQFLRPLPSSSATAASAARATTTTNQAVASLHVDVPKSNKGVFAFPKGSNAEPEHTMRILHEHARCTRGLSMLYNIEVTSIVREAFVPTDEPPRRRSRSRHHDRAMHAATAHVRAHPHLHAPTRSNSKQSLLPRRPRSPPPSSSPPQSTRMRWRVRWPGGSCTATHVVVAAGPGSKSILRSVGIDIGVTHVYGIMGESSVLTTPFYAGNIIASDAEVRWIVRDALVRVVNALGVEKCFGGRRRSAQSHATRSGGGDDDDDIPNARRLLDRTHCTAVWDGKTVTQLYRHLYAAVQVRTSGADADASDSRRDDGGGGSRCAHTSEQRRLCVGGPRIELPPTLGVREFDRLRPSMFDPEWYKCVRYLSQLLVVPRTLTFDPRHRWGGVMAFPDDELGPLMGTFEGFDGTLHVHTSYESSGFRQAMGGGLFLARLLCNGPAWADDLGSVEPLVRHWRKLLPTHRVRPCELETASRSLENKRE